MRKSTFGLQVKAAHGDPKAASDLQPGQFEAIVSVFGNEDSVGDVVLPGAFTKTLAEWAAKGDPIPVIWSHDWSDPFSHIGHVVDAKETERGLWIRAQIEDLDTNPKAAQVYRLLVGRRVTQMSFAYDVVDGGWGERDGSEVYELRELKLHEVGPCLLGANQETELLVAKARGLADSVKAGRVLSQKNYDRLVEARDAINDVIAAAEPEPEKTSPPSGGKRTEEPSQADGSPTDEEPDGAKSDQAAPSAPRRALAVATITTL